ncbi:MAG: FKBP-type peptidyl-prolyl cis-trans isomerase [Candidatus Heimdallarchaeum aukensis]|uniref:Peptidyl-prolyl cis-trans isomerase n=1 Tax=Candidatus Heimdallarchaeum aukensis TaxID=2876573 RepID=A0A9Y1BJ13_9ARCH|nr:MAG: FKBP-type peptidyl-prolyl cis-trans isomerase [Candidatus Heimdallarchaeum aukensis]
MRCLNKLLIFTILFLPVIFVTPIHSYDNGIQDNDLVSFGYHLLVDGKTIEYYDSSIPKKILFNENNIKPIGLYTRMLGMKIGEKRNFDVPPEEGFDASDPDYGYLAGKLLHYQNVEIYGVEGVSSTTSSPSGNFNFLKFIIVLSGIGGSLVLIYCGFKVYPKLFFKKCSICNKKAIGKCSKCGQSYCIHCFRNGCPSCNGRTLVRFKK